MSCHNKSSKTQTDSAASKALKDITNTSIGYYMSMKFLKLELISPLFLLLGMPTSSMRKADSSHHSAEEIIQVCVEKRDWKKILNS